jgi:FkbM family methyltransferase
MLPARVRGLIDVARFKLRDRLAKQVTVEDRGEQLRFTCVSHGEIARANTLFVKEEGTVQWIRSQVRAGDVFYDIGANIGIYTLLAARQVGPSGAVYAFEPHLGNVQSLLANVRANAVDGRVKVISSPLTDAEGFFDFHYRSAIAGSSGSQLGSTRDQNEEIFTPAFTEVKFGVSVDHLISKGVIRPPTHVKIDVDGNELLVIKGMRSSLGSPARPRTLQVEINLRYKEQLYALMTECGFLESHRHYTKGGKKAIAAGKNPDTIPYNAVFTPAP